MKTIILERIKKPSYIYDWYYLNLSDEEYEQIQKEENSSEDNASIKNKIRKYLNLTEWDGSWSSTAFSFWTPSLQYWKEKFINEN